MKKIIYLAIVAILFSSCTGVAPFSKQKYGHLKWIKKGAVIEQRTTEVAKVIESEKQNEINLKPIVENDNVSISTEVETEKGQEIKPTQNLAKTILKTEKNNKYTQIKFSETSDVKPNHAKKNKTVFKKFLKKPAIPSSDSDVIMVIAIICAFILPPLGVYLTRETSSPFMICLILCLLSWLFFLTPYGYGFGILWLIAIILALIAVLQDV
jgi:uncharacterized membrane protein YqaE (UPF0057 family)